MERTHFIINLVDSILFNVNKFLIFNSIKPWIQLLIYYSIQKKTYEKKIIFTLNLVESINGHLQKLK